MAERYQVRGLRIWDSKTDTYSSMLLDEKQAARWIKDGRARKMDYRPLTEWRYVEQRQSDPVNHPSHYTQGSIECIDAIASALGHDAFIEFLRGQVIKYMWRLGRKGDARQDAEKGTWYANRLVAELSK